MKHIRIYLRQNISRLITYSNKLKFNKCKSKLIRTVVKKKNTQKNDTPQLKLYYLNITLKYDYSDNNQIIDVLLRSLALVFVLWQEGSKFIQLTLDYLLIQLVAPTDLRLLHIIIAVSPLGVCTRTVDLNN